jgi:hypothetical protein
MFVIIDRKGGKTFDDLEGFLNSDGINTVLFKGIEEASKYINSHPLQNNNFLIHGSVGRSRVSFER